LGRIVRATGQHLAVFCLLLAGAAIVSWLMPLTVSAKTVFLFVPILFLLYLGSTYLVRKK